MYLEVEELKQYLNLNNTSQDEIIESMILASQDYVEHKTHRIFASEADDTRYFNPLTDAYGGSRVLRINEDLISITSITNGDGEVVSSSDYSLIQIKNHIIEVSLKRSTGLFWTYDEDPENAITIVGRWAYSLTPPNDIVQATKRLASYLFWQKDNANDLDRPFILGQITAMPPAMPRDVERILGRYIRRTVRS